MTTDEKRVPWPNEAEFPEWLNEVVTLVKRADRAGVNHVDLTNDEIRRLTAVAVSALKVQLWCDDRMCLDDANDALAELRNLLSGKGD